MPTNPYFNSYNAPNEQSLIEQLMTEAIKIQGFDGYYVLMEDDAPDLLFGDNPLRTFKNSYSIEMYLSNSMDPGLSGEFFSKFGLEIRNNTRVQVSRRSFNDIVPIKFRERPREGDLIYIPWASGVGELYEIKFVNDTKDGHTLGRRDPYLYELELEAFKYSHENIETGIEEIDVVNNEEAYALILQMDNTIIEYGIYGDGRYQVDELVYQGDDILTASAKGIVASWNETTNVLRITNSSGEFKTGISIIGNESGVSCQLYSFNPLDKPTARNEWDNLQVKTEEDIITDTSETNPFGSLGD